MSSERCLTKLPTVIASWGFLFLRPYGQYRRDGITLENQTKSAQKKPASVPSCQRFVYAPPPLPALEKNIIKFPHEAKRLTGGPYYFNMAAQSNKYVVEKLSLKYPFCGTRCTGPHAVAFRTSHVCCERTQAHSPLSAATPALCSPKDLPRSSAPFFVQGSDVRLIFLSGAFLRSGSQNRNFLP